MKILFMSDLLPYYKDLVVEISKKFPNEKIILRPHPSECLNMWQELVTSLENVEIRNNRLNLLGLVRNYSLKIADFKYLNS